MTPQFVTLADLYRKNCNLWMQCKGCGRVNTLTVWRLMGRTFVPNQTVPEMEDTTIASVLARVKCSSCGGREVEWTPMRRI
jgi:ribosomal protein L44E